MPLDIANWCGACRTGDRVADTLTFDSHFAGQFAVMRLFDGLALFFASWMVALTVVKELRDIRLAHYCVKASEAEIPPGWLRGLAFLGFVRRFVFVPMLVVAAVFLVIFDGGDAKSVCMNTVALLFMADIDDMMYEVALSEPWRTRMEEAGRVKLEDEQAKDLARTKIVHTALLTLSMPLNVYLLGTRQKWGGMLSMFLPFYLAAVDERVQAPRDHWQWIRLINRKDAENPRARLSTASRPETWDDGRLQMFAVAELTLEWVGGVSLFVAFFFLSKAAW